MDVVIFEYQNEKWRYHSRISPFSATKTPTSRILRGLKSRDEFTSIAVKGNIIAVGMQGEVEGDKGAVGIFQRNLKDDSWDVLKVLHDPEYPYVYTYGRLFGSSVVITDDYVVATPVGNERKLDTGVYLYDCRSGVDKVLYADGSEYKRLGEANVYSSGYIASGNGKILLTVPYLDENDAFMNQDAKGRIIVFEKEGVEWEAGVISAARTDITSGFDSLYLGSPIGFSGEMIAASFSGGVLADNKKDYEYESSLYIFERGKDDSWEHSAKIDIDGWASLGIIMDNETIIFGDSDGDPEYNGKSKFLVYRKNELGWELTDKIIPEDLPEVRKKYSHVAMSFSNDALVIGTETTPDFPGMGTYGDNLLPYFIGPIVDPRKQLKYPGKVCIYRLLPERGYMLEDVIGWERGKIGGLHFKSVRMTERLTGSRD
jgi:hypothetical protein